MDIQGLKRRHHTIFFISSRKQKEKKKEKEEKKKKGKIMRTYWKDSSDAIIQYTCPALETKLSSPEFLLLLYR